MRLAEPASPQFTFVGLAAEWLEPFEWRDIALPGNRADRERYGRCRTIGHAAPPCLVNWEKVNVPSDNAIYDLARSLRNLFGHPIAVRRRGAFPHDAMSARTAMSRQT